MLSREEILTITKSHKSVVNLQQLTCNNLNLDLGKVKAYAKFDQIPSIRSQDMSGNDNDILPATEIITTLL